MTREGKTDICQRAQEALANNPIYDLRDLRVEQQGPVLLISGCVGSFYHKQLAQEVVRSVAAGTQLCNTVDVQDDGSEFCRHDWD